MIAMKEGEKGMGKEKSYILSNMFLGAILVIAGYFLEPLIALLGVLVAVSGVVIYVVQSFTEEKRPVEEPKDMVYYSEGTKGAEIVLH